MNPWRYLEIATIASGMTLFWLAGTRAASADEPGLVVNHFPQSPPVGGLAADTDFITSIGEERAWQLVADDFMVADGAVVRRVRWWGFHNTNNFGNAPPASETLRVRFHDSRSGDGLPGNILLEETYLDPPRTDTGRIVLDPVQFAHEQVYQVDLSRPLLLFPDTQYWLEIVQIGDIDTRYRWEYADPAAAPLNGRAFINSIVTDWAIPLDTANLAFQLSTVPEPGALVLCLITYFVCVKKQKEEPISIDMHPH
jgi:hypothetical protein